VNDIEACIQPEGDSGIGLKHVVGKNIVTCRMVRVNNNYGIRQMIGFINTSVTHTLLIT
jgi:hypothetical protein